MVTGNLKKILVHLKKVIDRDGENRILYSNHFELSFDTGIKETSIKTTTQKLKELGYISIERSKLGMHISLTDIAFEMLDEVEVKIKKPSPMESNILKLVNPFNKRTISFNSHDVAKSIGTSVATIRNAFTRMQKKGLVDKIGYEFCEESNSMVSSYLIKQ
tara:strand:- start:2005 stop:2487 length:483 start_codon:yes stop_codon:yes gene_type:complete